MASRHYKELTFINGIDNVSNVRTLKDGFCREAINVNIDNDGNVGTGKITAPDISVTTQYASFAGVTVDNLMNFTGYSGSDTTLPFKRAMQAGELVTFHNFRLYVTLGGRFIWSDALAFDRYDIRNFRSYVGGYLTMFMSVDDGIWLSFGGKTFFIAGPNPEDFKIIEKADYGAIGQAVEVPSEFIGFEGVSGKTVMWMSERGVCVGSTGGSMINMSIDKYKLPTGTRRAKSLINITNNSQAYFLTTISA